MGASVQSGGRITSLSNSKIKWIRKLKERRHRDEAGLYWIEGLRIVAEAVQLDADLDTLIVAPELVTSQFGRELIDKMAARGVPLLEVSSDVFKSFSLKEGPQGIAALVRQHVEPLEGLSVNCDWVALDSIADPGNLGTILRTNDAVGGAGLILLDHSTDPFDPTCVRASMGALFSQRLVRASLAQFSEWKRANHVHLVGTSGGAARDYTEVEYPQSLVLLMGNERQGLSEEAIRFCDQMVAIPMRGRSDSLNLAIATAIILYQIFNQHRGRAWKG
ncbi:MAG TPA: RNA methyltransferase [Anaerolineaceae bacterium]|nr:RNA methyltransferase [Anaerolineaceae bacterium]